MHATLAHFSSSSSLQDLSCIDDLSTNSLFSSPADSLSEYTDTQAFISTDSLASVPTIWDVNTSTTSPPAASQLEVRNLTHAHMHEPTPAQTHVCVRAHTRTHAHAHTHTHWLWLGLVHGNITKNINTSVTFMQWSVISLSLFVCLSGYLSLTQTPPQFVQLTVIC